MSRIKAGNCNLQQLLDSRGMTQVQLASIVNMSKNQISDYATNRRKMERDNLKTIANALGVKMESLYEWITYD